ncbi:MAG: hypothetical protein ACJ8NR_16635 [Sulfurifustis sp.]
MFCRNVSVAGRHRWKWVRGAVNRTAAGAVGDDTPFGTVETVCRALLTSVLVDQGAGTLESLQAEVSDLLASVHDPEMFEQRLLALALHAAVLDGTQLVRRTQACLSKNVPILRSAGRRVLRRLHVSTASWCDKAGYAHLAAAHLVRGALLNPIILFRRRSIGILVRSLSGSNSRSNRLLQNEVVRMFRLFNERGVRAHVFGSLAISFHAGTFVKHHGDIDLAFPTEADTHRAAMSLVDELKYRIVTRYEWTGLTGERCFHIALNAPSGMRVELSYLPENPSVKDHVVVVDGVRVRTADLRGLRNIYALFLLEKAAISHDLEKQSKKNAILTIDRLLSSGGV